MSKKEKILLTLLIAANLFVWINIAGERKVEALNLYFLDVGQGDSSLAILPGNVKILTDGGPDKSVLYELAEVLSTTDRYIDIIAVTHAQKDHFYGLIDVLKRYKVGTILWSGRDGEIESWNEFKRIAKEKNVPMIIIDEADQVKYKESTLTILSPDVRLLNNKEINESSLVTFLESEGVKILGTGDIGTDTEKYLTKKYDLDIDILKVPHHGSKYSSSKEFLSEATPALSVIQVGKNSYGHPTKDALSRLANIAASVYRNDKNGRIHLEIENRVIKIFEESNY
ncbi:MAG: hypothetical protein A3H06_00325 [Candidatus Colwellbacteria bacterium RIFCSPLOWO2_12_FULL_44_13]|uniref:Metallo-beta-lactamase domain-containing protein n=3 Tax=Candidatus Colwelliibacteriota TaxID=1817904 RepID=A0A1G1Z9I0_9BACT|nr:MAG: hypothetical protein A3F24_02555 [Candidatus Colwellbacteria bacterium RIFCSPHIGHO2_12_FULL_44_17]OGY60277.1 MAG: hypothetical protein A3I31_00315 [Candidatus Colwellbacteria bacterium RIFCSPLOWO2_02_FULL_44_20b]OGY61538.1 MAG: hypothetical protein A3H06_00325 [Candidatus Colwellbacteria bacterium RIFCSPLOWO2_12_FULL_44_13]